MTENSFCQIPLEQITPSPFNPRKNFDDVKLDELTASIKEKGVIEPIVVRKLAKGKHPYEIVVGERRFRAAYKASLVDIPSMVRELTDDEAIDFQLIENLQRDDPTAFEEAQSFKGWAARHGKDSIVELSEKTGIRPSYIRARIAVLKLPPKALDSWKKGDLNFAHLEQILRLPSANLQREMVDRVKRGDMSALALRKEIDGQQVSLSAALFDTKKPCSGCQFNSLVQRELFGVGDGKASCQHPKCFIGKQGEWLKNHWLETPESIKYKTKGFQFEEDFRSRSWDTRHHFEEGNKIPKKCFDCESFISIVGISGKIERGYRNENARACVGDTRCWNSAQQSIRSADKIKDRENKKAAVAEGKQARVTWHGEYFRNAFFKKRVPEVLAGMGPDDTKVKTLLLMCLAHANDGARSVIKKSLGFRDEFGASDAALKKLLGLPYPKIADLFKGAVNAVFQEGQNVGDWNWHGFGSTNRRLVAEFLGIDLSKEWAADEEYLKKKTRMELINFAKKSGILAAAAFGNYIRKTLKKEKGDPEKLKKSELVDAILKSGVNLIGRVPDEVLKKE